MHYAAALNGSSGNQTNNVGRPNDPPHSGRDLDRDFLLKHKGM